jgi:hypothetical protein
MMVVLVLYHCLCNLGLEGLIENDRFFIKLGQNVVSFFWPHLLLLEIGS